MGFLGALGSLTYMTGAGRDGDSGGRAGRTPGSSNCHACVEDSRRGASIMP